MKKRVLSLVLACMLAVSAAACGKDGSKQGGQTGQDATGGQDAAQGTESGTDGSEDSSAQAVWVETEKEEPVIDWSAVEEAPEEDFRFSGVKLSGCAGVEINEYLGEGGVVIPDGVIRVVRYAAWENENITSLTVPDSVQRIEAGSFGKCVNLTRVSLPDGIRTIGGPYGFAGDPDIVITYQGKEYTYEQLEELDSIM